MIDINWKEAEKILGFKVNRRKKYGKLENDETELLGCEEFKVFQVCIWPNNREWVPVTKGVSDA